MVCFSLIFSVFINVASLSSFIIIEWECITGFFCPAGSTSPTAFSCPTGYALIMHCRYSHNFGYGGYKVPNCTLIQTFPFSINYVYRVSCPAGTGQLPPTPTPQPTPRVSGAQGKSGFALLSLIGLFFVRYLKWRFTVLFYHFLA